MTTLQLYEKAKLLPLLPGVYIIRNKKDEIIYIGKAKKLRTRVSQYFRVGVPHDAKVTKMISNAFELDVIVTQSEFEALVLECSQIKLHRPKYNILLKDDKGYCYVKITKELYPRISAQLQRSDANADYIGPFTSSFAVREMVETAIGCFKLPTCTKRFPQEFKKARPCLNYHIGKCMGICQGKIQQEEYSEYVASAIKLIKQGKTDIIKILQTKMFDASEKMDFERAAVIRDQISAIEKVAKGQKVVDGIEKSQDVIAFAAGAGAVCAAILRYRDSRLVDKREFVFYDTNQVEAVRQEFLPRYYFDEISQSPVYDAVPGVIAIDSIPEEADILAQLLAEEKGTKVRIYTPERGDNAKLVQMAYLNAMDRLAREKGRYAKEDRVLEEMAGLLGLETVPNIIESYDISNWGEGTSVAGMVVFENGKPKRSGYRRFKINSVIGTDDYASMAETLERRVAEYNKGENLQFKIKPDLILLDGGKGQVSVVKKVLQNTSFGNVPLFGMVKDSKHRTRAVITSDGNEVCININRGVFSFITSVQDEVHRFAINYQRTAQKTKAFSSSLTKIEGVGEKTAKLLLKELKTISAISTATAVELAQIKGISKAVAENICEHFKNK